MFGTGPSSRLYSVGEVIASAFEAEQRLVEYLQMRWEDAKEESSTGSCTGGRTNVTERAQLVGNTLEKKSGGRKVRNNDESVGESKAGLEGTG